jgi:ribosomal protein L11 methyltransferase
MPRITTASMRDVWSLSITTSPEAEEAIAELLARISGSPAAIIQDLASGFSTVAIYARPGRFWGPRRGRDFALGLAAIARSGLRIHPARIRWWPLQPTDWRESWKRHFKAFLVGRSLLVRPSWSSRRPAAGQVEVVLNPGMSFGTGQHPTTAYCLREIVRCRPRAVPVGGVAERRMPTTVAGDGSRASLFFQNPSSLRDVGTGSGILAIAAARLGYRPVAALDVDPAAIRVARHNARLNGVAKSIDFATGDLGRMRSSPRPGYTVICANLTADILASHADLLLSSLEPGGLLVVAGILRSQFASVRERFERLGARMVRSRAEAEWHSATFAMS